MLNLCKNIFKRNLVLEPYHWNGASFMTPYGTKIGASVEYSGRPVVWLSQYQIFKTAWKSPVTEQSAPSFQEFSVESEQYLNPKVIGGTLSGSRLSKGSVRCMVEPSLDGILCYLFVNDSFLWVISHIVVYHLKYFCCYNWKCCRKKKML